MNHEELLSKIIEAKEKIGDRAIQKIVDYYHVENFNEQKKAGCCPFHKEKTPSFIWNAKDQCFSCFGCGRRTSLLDLYVETEGSYINAVKKLCEEAEVEINLSQSIPSRKDYFATYKFPTPEESEDKEVVYEYLGKRGISRSTIDYMGIVQDSRGNIVFQMHDIDGTLVCKKYRPSHKVKHGSPKYWWDSNSDKCPILYNLDKIDFTKPLLIVEGMIDVVSVVEAGYKNAVSIPSGAEDMNWIEFNYEILDNIPEFILWFDNDSAGQSGLKKVITRLGEYRCKIVKPSLENENGVEQYYKGFSPNSSIRKTDANNILLACGQKEVLRLIENAEEIPIENMIDLMSAEEFNIEDAYYIPSGFKELDRQIYGYIDGSLNVWTAYAGVGKALTLDSDLLGEHGYFKMGDVKFGDMVYGDDGKLHKVVGVYPQGKLDTYKVTFDDDTYVLCSDEHLWTVVTQNISNEDKTVIWKERTLLLKEIIDDDDFKNGKLFIPPCKPVSFKRKRLVGNPYLIGVECKDKPIPEEYKLSSIEDRTEIIRGLFDCCAKQIDDGCGYNYISISEQHIKDVQFIINSFGGTLKYHTEKRNGMVYYCADVKFIYTHRKICSIEYVGKKKCQCIMVNNPSHLYLTNNCIVTHNTTLIGQSCVLEAIDRGENVFWFNAESTTGQMLNWILSQAAGRQHTVEYTTATGFKYYKPTPEAVKAIKLYYANKVFVYDNLLLSNANDVLEKMKYMYKKRGIKVFILDNWLCLNFRGKSDAEVTSIQVDFMNNLIHFAKKNQLEIHLVAHPRKPQANTPLNQYEILGSSNIVNMVDRIYGLEKTWNEDLKALQFDRQFTVFKDRILGVDGNVIGLRYDKATRRLYGDSDDIYRRYSWDDGSIKYVSTKFGNNGELVGRRTMEWDKNSQGTDTGDEYGDFPF